MGKPRLPDVEKQELLDLPMLLLTLLLTALGLVMIYSSSFARALYESGDSAFYFKRQLVFAGTGHWRHAGDQPGAASADPKAGISGSGGLRAVSGAGFCAGHRTSGEWCYPLGASGHILSAL